MKQNSLIDSNDERQKEIKRNQDILIMFIIDVSRTHDIYTIVDQRINLPPDVSQGRLTHVHTDLHYRRFLFHMVNVLDVIGIYDNTH